MAMPSGEAPESYMQAAGYMSTAAQQGTLGYQQQPQAASGVMAQATAEAAHQEAIGTAQTFVMPMGMQSVQSMVAPAPYGLGNQQQQQHSAETASGVALTPTPAPATDVSTGGRATGGTSKVTAGASSRTASKKTSKKSQGSKKKKGGCC